MLKTSHDSLTEQVNNLTLLAKNKQVEIEKLKPYKDFVESRQLWDEFRDFVKMMNTPIGENT